MITMYMYGRWMILPVKFKDTEQRHQPGRIGMCGCAVGSWIKLACKEARLRESDFMVLSIVIYMNCASNAK